MRVRLLLSSLLPAVFISTAAAQIPAVTAIGREESVSSSYMEHPAISTDSKGQPHVVADFGIGNNFMKFHRVGNRWSGGIFATGQRGSRYNASRLYIGQIEIDSKDRAWISCKFGVKEYGTMHGQGVWLFRDVASNPNPPEQFFRFVNVYKGMGLVSTDAKYPDQGVVLGTFGNWNKLNASGQSLGSGSINAGQGGEKVRFRIASFAPRFGGGAASGYADGIWHTAMNGFSGSGGSYYQNSARYKAGAGPVTWAAYRTYPAMGDDYCHPGLGIDLANPRIAYIGSVFGRTRTLGINIWDGNRLLFNPSALKVLDYTATYEGRHSVQFAPVPSGGTFVFWSAGNQIKMHYLSPKGVTTGAPTVVATGRSPGAATDRYGNIHLVYYNGGIKYRKIHVSVLRAIRPEGRVTATRTPTFTWTGTKAAAYTIELTRDGEKLAPFGVKATAWTPPDNLAVGAYSWRVKEGWPKAATSWSKPLAFVIPPARSAPIAPKARYPKPRKPFFSWTCDDPAANRFHLQLFQGSDLLGAHFVNQNRFATWPTVLPAGSYSWRIQSINAANNRTVSSAWSPLTEFQVAVPGGSALVKPAPLEVFPPGWQTITGTWTQATGADSYKLKLLFNGKLLEQRFGITRTKRALTRAYSPGYYSLLVQPKNESGLGPWSPVRTFIVTRLMTPGNHATRHSPPAALEWTRSPNATRYLVKLAVYDAGRNAYRVIREKWVAQPKWGSPSWKPNVSFAKAAYRWTVTDYVGQKQGYTSLDFFQVKVPGRPDILSPKGPVYGHRMLPFEWQDPSRFAEAFQVQIWKGSVKLKDSGWLSAAELDKTLTLFGKLYYFPNEGSGACTWRVRGKNSMGLGPWRQAWFTAHPLGSPAFHAPLENARALVGNPLPFAWEAIPHAAGYEIAIFQNGNLIASEIVTDTQWSWTPETAGAFTARVRAGETGWSYPTTLDFTAVNP